MFWKHVSHDFMSEIEMTGLFVLGTELLLSAEIWSLKTLVGEVVSYGIFEGEAGGEDDDQSVVAPMDWSVRVYRMEQTSCSPLMSLSY